MKYIKYIGAAVAIASLTACDLDEVYKSEMDVDMVYTTTDGYNGLINSCYENVYYMYGKEDGLAMMEAGDLWQNGSATSSAWKECMNNYDWNTEVGPNKTMWNGLYAIVAYCNTAIYYKDKCTGYDKTALNAKCAEAYFMRAFAYFHIVEQWGGVTLTTQSMAEAGSRISATRSSEDEIYDQIICDLDTAFKYLPETQAGERGRATKTAAAAMLCKAWMQRSRLERDYAENKDGKTGWISKIVADGASLKYGTKQCADSAYTYAKWVIEKGTNKLYESTADQSGSTQEWADEHNKDNKEFIFCEAIDHVNGYNPEGWNRGRSRQYLMMSFSSDLRDYTGLGDQSLRYGRSNTTRVHPSLYLLHDCFEPKPLDTEVSILANSYTTKVNNPTYTYDTRFSDSFYYKYFTSSTADILVPKDLYYRWGKDTTYYNKYVDSNPSIFTIKGTAKKKTEVDPSLNYYGSASPISDSQSFEITLDQHVYYSSAAEYNADKGYKVGDKGYITSDATAQTKIKVNATNGMCVFAPNWPLDSAWCAQKVYICAGLPYMNEDIKAGVTNGRFAYFRDDYYVANNSLYRAVCPSIKKLSPMYYVYDAQYSMNDFPIIRLTDIYLLGAEATVLSGHNQSDGLTWLNKVREHAARLGNASKMDVDMSSLTIDFLSKERARELVGECWRWYDLKRMGLLTKDYLNDKAKMVYQQTYNKKWYVRPIPQQFLDEVANPDEYGTNGY